MSTATTHIQHRMLEWFGVIFEPGQVVEVRGLKPNRSAFFRADRFHLEGIVRRARKLTAECRSVYFSINHVSDSKLTDGRKAAGDQDIVRRLLILFDFDPKRPADVSSTDAEKALALAAAERMRAELRAEGWPEPVLADSGNGYHVLYRIDLPADDQNLVRRCLLAASARFGTDAVDVDRKVYNPSRICKFYGTWTRKGESTDDRPHRLSRVLDLPEHLELVPGELLEALADSVEPPLKAQPARPTNGETRPGVRGGTALARYIAKALAEEVANVANAIPGDRNDQLNKSAFALGQLVGPELSRETIVQNLTAAAEAVKLGGDEATKTIASGIDAGILEPRDLSHVGQMNGHHHANGAARPKAETSSNSNGNGAANVTVEAGDDEPEDDEEDDILDRWPKPQPLAFYGLAGDIVRALEPHTEADPMGVLIQLLVGFGSMIGRRPHFTVGATKHRMNLFTALVGPTASGRKGTAWDMAHWVLSPFDPDWAANRIQGGLVSGEGLIHHVRDAAYEEKEVKGPGGSRKRERVMVDGGVSDKRLLILETEMGRLLKAMGRDANTTSDVVRQAWEKDRLAVMGKNKGAIATGAHVSIIGHITRADVGKHMADEDMLNGFGNRFAWVAVRRSKELPDGGDIYSREFEHEWEPIKHRLERTVAYAREVDRMERDLDARRLWKGLYGTLTAGKPGRLGAVLSRAEPQVMRLACVYALLDESSYVHPEHLAAALALWDYCEASARYTFGDAFANPAGEKLLEALKAAPEGISRGDITTKVFGGNKPRAEINGLLSEMLTEGLVHRTRVKAERGRPKELWRAGRGA